MKNFLIKSALTAFVIFSAGVCGAQNFKMMPVGVPDATTGEFSLNPATTLVVDVTVRQETVTTGPYARFAQKLLGVIAPLSDKELHEIVNVKVQAITSTEPMNDIGGIAAPVVNNVSHLASGDSFGKVQYDKTSFSTRNVEDAARDAAQAIFNIRKRRAELVMGDVGENVYGAGMSAALERLDQMENSYLELFFGKQAVSEYTLRYYVTPEAGKKSYTFCRFNDTRGVLDVSDLSGQPILLELEPSGDVSRIPDRKSKNSKENEYAVAENMTYRVTDGTVVYRSGIVPVFQFGKRIFM